ncbi:MAG: helix-turn-helix transcriptional regulator [Burkholderiales bacterium]|nr:helix-turn-helix transcriptional regulator [Burkholderiales bacterium]HQY10262.1 helix-turn-helix transcriptional regulator [Burkholderiaceae bacterium]
MITNQRQQQFTQHQAERFRGMLASAQAPHPHPKVAQAMRAGWEDQLSALEAELADYDALQRTEPTTLEADSIVGIGEALIKARIARRLTHRELAERMQLAEQQVQRWEATRYRGVAAERLQQVADALRLRVREVFTFEPG